MKDGFVRVACITPAIKTAGCVHNAREICRLAAQAAGQGAGVLVFPELCLTGYTCGDLFLQRTLIDGAACALMDIAGQTALLDALIVVGLPLFWHSGLYNCAAVIFHGRVLGVVPKQHLPNYGEFYEQRHFTSGKGVENETILLGGQAVPFGTDLLFAHASLPDFVLGVEICEDLWVPQPPSGKLARAGATLIVNPSASDEAIGKAAYRNLLLASASARLCCAYAYAGAGQGESTQDMVFAGHNLIYENGTLLAQSGRFAPETIYADVDLSKMASERRRMNTFEAVSGMRTVAFDLPVRPLELRRKVEPRPFVPSDPSALAARCEEILTIQSAGLEQRLRHIQGRSAVVGLSGGLDSTLALIVAVRAFDRLGIDRSGITAVSMPCFGTTGRTKNNAQQLAQAYGVSFREIPIAQSVRQHFADIGHLESVHDVTYENAQARERTQVLMDIANQTGGIVIGTGDLSELALGWATYNGDHMSMYGVNASVPKTLVRYLVAYEAQNAQPTLGGVLRDVLDTPVSPELLPPVDGKISQKTEELVGPYELHDFFLYYFVRCGFDPAKIYRLARGAFAGVYDNATILKWLQIFLKRFFAQQFKRSCLPDGPKVGSVTLSPRGDWRMPSDAAAQLWLDQAQQLKP